MILMNFILKAQVKKEIHAFKIECSMHLLSMM